MAFSIKGVFPAAGLGTRFLPATKSQPKEMLPIYDRPAIQYVIDEALAAGINDILIITGRNKQSISDYFDRSPELEMFLESKGKIEDLESIRSIAEKANLHYLRQKEALGLGHAILTAETFVGDSTFAVFLADDIVHPPESGKSAIEQMIDVHKKTGGSVIALEAVPREKISSYGVIAGEKVGDRLHKLTGVVEKPPVETAPSNLTIVGRYLLKPSIFKYLRDTKPGRNGEIQITDAIAELLKNEDVYGLEIEGRRYDTGEPVGFLEATVEFALRSDSGDQIKDYLKRLVARF